MTQSVNKRISECIAARGSYTSDKQKYSSYPFAFDRNCPYGVSDKEIIDRDNIKVCQPHLPPFQNQYTIHSHFQDLFLNPDCPSCIAETNSVCNKTNDLNNNPQCLKNDCLIVDPNATQFASIPMPVCFDGNTDYSLPTSNMVNPVNPGNSGTIYQNAVNSTFFNLGNSGNPNISENQTISATENFVGDIFLALSWIIGIFLVLTLISYFARQIGLQKS